MGDSSDQVLREALMTWAPKLRATGPPGVQPECLDGRPASSLVAGSAGVLAAVWLLSSGSDSTSSGAVSLSGPGMLSLPRGGEA